MGGIRGEKEGKEGRKRERKRETERERKEKLLPNPSKVLSYYKEDSYLIRVNTQVLSLAT